MVWLGMTGCRDIVCLFSKLSLLPKSCKHQSCLLCLKEQDSPVLLGTVLELPVSEPGPAFQLEGSVNKPVCPGLVMSTMLFSWS